MCGFAPPRGECSQQARVYGCAFAAVSCSQGAAAVCCSKLRCGCGVLFCGRHLHRRSLRDRQRQRDTSQRSQKGNGACCNFMHLSSLRTCLRREPPHVLTTGGRLDQTGPGPPSPSDVQLCLDDPWTTLGWPYAMLCWLCRADGFVALRLQGQFAPAHNADKPWAETKSTGGGKATSSQYGNFEGAGASTPAAG